MSSAQAATSRRITKRMRLRFHIGDSLWLEAVEKLTGRLRIKLRIARLDTQEKAVARHLLEFGDVEDRMIRHRQTVEDEHPNHPGERSEQHRHLKGNWHKRRQ